MAVTQADVAALAGVSRKTVSNVVNGYPHVSRDLVRRVQAAVRELGYVPNHAARSLRTGRTRTMQLVVPELDVPYFAELARDVVRAAESAGMSVLIRQTFGDLERELRAIEGEYGDHTDGTILSPVAVDLDAITGRRSQAPVVLVGELHGGPTIPHVGIDNEQAAFVATSHLVTRGRTRIGLIGAQTGSSSHMASMRRAGWERALAQAGLPAREELVRYTAGYHRHDGAHAMRDLLLAARQDIDGVFCATDLLALGAIRAARDAGVDIPGDVAVVGFDNIDDGRFSVPRLTTIAPDKAAIAQRAVGTLLDMLEAIEEERTFERADADEVVPFELVVRESSG